VRDVNQASFRDRKLPGAAKTPQVGTIPGQHSQSYEIHGGALSFPSIDDGHHVTMPKNKAYVAFRC
jgi:hypothetical protein